MSIHAVAPAAGGVLLSGVLLLSTAPSAQAAAKDAPLPVAHRGASAYAPENTLAAVDRAHELDIDWVENDVQRTKDGELVVIHDTTLDRTTDAEEVFPDRAPWNVGDFTLEEISRLDAGGWFDKDFKGERVPTLEQYLNRLDDTGQHLLLELKSPELYPGVEAEILKELDEKGWLDRGHVRDKLILQSFNADAVRTVHHTEPAVKTGFLGNPKAGELADYAKFADQINPQHTAVTKEYVDAIHGHHGPHGRPLETFTWTVNDAATARAMADAGVDGLISNKPDVVRDAAS